MRSATGTTLLLQRITRVLGQAILLLRQGDPRFELCSFDQLWPQTEQSDHRQRSRTQFHATYDRYKHRPDGVESLTTSYNTNHTQDPAADADSDDDLYITSR